MWVWKWLRARPRRSRARCDVAFGLRASGRSGCQDNWQSAEHEPSDAVGRRQKQTEMLAGWSLSEPHSQLSFSMTHCGAGLEEEKAHSSQVCAENSVKYLVFLAHSSALAFCSRKLGAGRTKRFTKHIPEVEFFYKTSDTQWWSLYVLPSSVSLSLPLFSVYLQLPSELTLLFPPARQTILPGLIQVSDFLLSMDFSFIMHQHRGYNVPNWLVKFDLIFRDRQVSKTECMKAELLKNMRSSLLLNLLPEAVLVQITDTLLSRF